MSFDFSDVDRNLDVLIFDDYGEYLLTKNMLIKANEGLPAKSTIDSLPALGVGEVAVRNGTNTAWVPTFDYRGTSYWEQDGTEVEITTIDVSPPAGTLTTAPPSEYHTTHDGTAWILDVAGQLAGLKEDLSDNRNTHLETGATVNGVVFKADNDSLAVMSIKERSMASTIMWKGVDGVFTSFTSAEFTARYTAVFGFNEAAYVNESSICDELNTASDPTTVDINTGWPNPVITV